MSQQPSRSDKYYLYEPMVVIQVEDVLYRVHWKLMAKESSILAALIEDASSASPKTGWNDSNPIHLRTTKDEFEGFLFFVYDSDSSEPTPDQCCQAIYFSSSDSTIAFDCPNIMDRAIVALHHAWDNWSIPQYVEFHRRFFASEILRDQVTQRIKQLFLERGYFLTLGELGVLDKEDIVIIGIAQQKLIRELKSEVAGGVSPNTTAAESSASDPSSTLYQVWPPYSGKSTEADKEHNPSYRSTPTPREPRLSSIPSFTRSAVSTPRNEGNRSTKPLSPQSGDWLGGSIRQSGGSPSSHSYPAQTPTRNNTSKNRLTSLTVRDPGVLPDDSIADTPATTGTMSRKISGTASRIVIGTLDTVSICSKVLQALYSPSSDPPLVSGRIPGGLELPNNTDDPFSNTISPSTRSTPPKEGQNALHLVQSGVAISSANDSVVRPGSKQPNRDSYYKPSGVTHDGTNIGDLLSSESEDDSTGDGISDNNSTTSSPTSGRSSSAPEDEDDEY